MAKKENKQEYKYKGASPENREPDIQKLLSHFITPTDDVYDRNHSEYPSPAQSISGKDADEHRICIGGDLLPKVVEVSVQQLRAMEQHEVLCCLQCAGNRRHTMRTKLREVSGIDWFDGAVANCRWRGPRLRDVLKTVGVEKVDGLRNGEDEWVGHVECLSQTVPCEDTDVYGGSITLQRAMLLEGDCILALEMNDQKLNVKHGAPVRAVFPGILGARSVKWLTHINISAHESNNHYQQRDYKVLPAAATDAKAAEQYWDRTPAMNDMPVNSIIGVPESGSIVSVDDDGTVEVKGYALPAGMDGPVVRVEVSGDEGQTWVDAELDFNGEDAPGLHKAEGRRKVRWAWALWRARVQVAPGTSRKIVSRATDAKGNTQPKQGLWTLRGVGYNAWGEAENLTVVSPDELPSSLVVGNGLQPIKS